MKSLKKLIHKPVHHLVSFGSIGLAAALLIGLDDLTPLLAKAQTPPCPGFVIEGFGKDTTGGCGGEVVTVNTLSNTIDAWDPTPLCPGCNETAIPVSLLKVNPGPDGKISFKEAIMASGTRIVNFSVSGLIDLNTSFLRLRQDNITIDGSTAPNGGIGLKNGGLGVHGSNVIIRHMRFHAGELTTNTPPLAIYGDGGQAPRNVVIDHVTACHGTDGDLDITNSASYITVQWSIMCENNGIKAPGSTAVTYDANHVSLHHNLWANSQTIRNPYIAATAVDHRNNVVYRNHNHDGAAGWYFENLTSVSPYFSTPATVNIVGNYWKAGGAEVLHPDSKPIIVYGQDGYSTDDSDIRIGAPNSRIYLFGNIGPTGRTSDTQPQKDIIYEDNGGLPLVTTELTGFPPVTTTSAFQAYNDVILTRPLNGQGVGATLPCRSSSDKRVVNYVINAGRGAAGGEAPGWGFTTMAQVGGYPNLPQLCAEAIYPTVSVTAPSVGATVFGTSVPVSANASDNVGVVGVQFQLDGVNLGAEDTTAPYSISWNSRTATNGSHTITALARDAAQNLTISSPVSVTVNNPPIPNGLIAAYSFNEGSGTTIGEQYGINSPGTLTNGPVWTAGKYGQAVDLDGTNDYIVINNPSNIPTGDFTYSFWVNLDTANDETVVMRPNTSGGNELYLVSETARFGAYVDGTRRARTNVNTVPTGTWTHIAVTRSGGDIRIYINGIQNGSTGHFSGALSFGSCPLYLGVDIDSGCSGGLGNYMNGRLDELRIYNRALTQTEIQTDMNTPIGQ